MGRTPISGGNRPAGVLAMGCSKVRRREGHGNPERWRWLAQIPPTSPHGSLDGLATRRCSDRMRTPVRAGPAGRSRPADESCGAPLPRHATVRIWAPPRLQAPRSLAVRYDRARISGLDLRTDRSMSGHDRLFARRLPIALSGFVPVDSCRRRDSQHRG